MNSRLDVLEDLGVVFAAGGSGSRFESGNAEENKLFADFEGLPVFIHSIMNFSKACPQKNMALVINPLLRQRFLATLYKYFPNSELRICDGGQSRMHSVFNGLSRLPDGLKFAAVHDSARPLTSSNLLINAYKCALLHGSAVVGRRVCDTVKRTDKDSFVLEEISREGLWRVETPQIFIKGDLLAAYEKAFKDGFKSTDDAGAMSHAGHPVRMFESSERNIKITYPGDLKRLRTEL